MPRETGTADATPLQKLERLLNILPNGGQSLTVLSMPPSSDRWTYYTHIANAVNSKVGFPVVRKTNTQKALTQTLEPIGIAAKSDIDDKVWALTDFGVDLRPALIFGWQGFTELDINTSALLSSISARGKHTDGVRTAGMTRFKIIQGIYELTHLSAEQDNQGVSEYEISQYTGFNLEFVGDHTHNLEKGGFLDKDSKARTLTTFTVTEKGSALATWSTYVAKNQAHPQSSVRGHDVIVSLQSTGDLITNKTVAQRYLELFGRNLGEGHASTLLSFWAKNEQGFLERHGFSLERGSDVVLRPITEAVLAKVLLPLEQWAYNSLSVGKINQIREQLNKDPDSFVPLYRNIAESYEKYSPFKNKDLEGKTAMALEIISTSPGVSYTELSTVMDTSVATARRIVEGLILSGTVRREEPETGNRVNLFVNSQE